MSEYHYQISEASRLLAVEAHVLRYWEEELELSVPRNEMGHRYYTKENINEFLKIKELKDVTDKTTYTITFNLNKEDGEWKLQDITDVDRQKIHGLY